MPKKSARAKVMREEIGTAYRHAEERESIMLPIMLRIGAKDVKSIIDVLREYADDLDANLDATESEVQQDLFLLANEIY